jgi:2-dehydro-3-deoxy-D-gluconate 5-dehydrogenase
MSLFSLDGKVAIITGGNGGIGRGIAQAYADAGARVVIAARNDTKSSIAAKAIGGHCIAISLNVSNEASCADLVAEVMARFGRCDILVANAGINIRKPPDQLTLREWAKIIDTNLTGAFLICSAVYPAMRGGGGGKVICIGSMYSLFGAPMVTAYAASKGGVVQLAKSLACAWAPDNIQVNSILPGWIATDLTATARIDIPSLDQHVLSRTPAGRWGEPDDITGCAIFLASAASNFVTGATIAVDGGFSIRG